MSEKLDGIRAYWNGKQLVSRSGKIIHAPKWFTKGYPPFPIDGELWSKRDDFSNISSIVRDKVPSSEWEQIKHHIFEAPNAKGDLKSRLSLVIPYINNHIKLVKQISIQSKEQVDIFHKNILSKSGEGVVIRDPNAPYISKRTNKALKLKKFHDKECNIIGYTKGKGKYTDLIGAIICQMDNGIKFKIGSGLSDTFRKNPPDIGTQVTFKYQNLTKNGKPRFPVFLRIRN